MTNMAYLASSGLCIGAIACLSNQKTARTGNALGLMGVGGGIAATLGAIGGTVPLYGQIAGKLSKWCTVPLACCLSLRAVTLITSASGSNVQALPSLLLPWAMFLPSCERETGQMMEVKRMSPHHPR